ncbi:hypothetical protein [Bradyrhizobium elkanii]|uniref:Putative DNA-binding transcriptional regulator AlpA n=1 Tax=Bradyrhizobium elkanii TaxID=29448 RepID=A0A8I2C6Y1_BRAEL|nr:hypothetical protein [Bradyrhizobium elkanii]MBP1296648.1 putative DNA-binding transcriptional regulator AlpA [Bradyrhizobium elkanii]
MRSDRPRAIGEPMHCREIAERLGVHLQTFYKNRERYHLLDKMPRPITTGGHPRYDRAMMEAWFRRNDPRLPQLKVANDPLPPPTPASDEQWRAFLHQHYQPAE